MANTNTDYSPTETPATEATKAKPKTFTAQDAFDELLEPNVDATLDQVTEHGRSLLEDYVAKHEDPIRGVAAREAARAMLREHRISGLFEANPPKVEHADAKAGEVTTAAESPKAKAELRAQAPTTKTDR